MDGKINATETLLNQLDRDILAAHAAGRIDLLPALYHQAGLALLARDDVDHACFFLTQAYIFALETGDARAGDIHRILVHYGREE